MRTTAKGYDEFDRLLSVVDPRGEAITYTYDANGNRSTVSDPDGLTTIYAYDALNRVISVTAPGGVTEYEWFKDSRLQKVTYPNTTSARHTYDAAGRTDTIENRQGVAAVVSSYGYSYDQNGNRTEQIETNGGAAETTTYEYDEADRLLSVEYPDRTVTYTYDDVGNRRSETIVAGSTTLSDRTYAYDERNRLESITDSADPAFDTTFVYDANGNQASKTRDGTTTSFLYDTRDRIVEIQEDATTLETYLYDYQGLRVRRSGSGGTVRYVYDDQSVLVETTDGGTTVSKYEYGPDRLLSLDNSTEGRQYYLQDALRSVVTLTRPDGGIQARYKYDAWGNLRDEVGSSANRFGFTGHEHDEETGLIYAKARYYDPEIGLFLTEDPFQGTRDNPPSLHRYLYGFQNPSVFVDPTGRDSEEVVADDENGARPDRKNIRIVRSGDSGLKTIDAATGEEVEYDPESGEYYYKGTKPPSETAGEDTASEPEKSWWEAVTEWFMESVEELATDIAESSFMFDSAVEDKKSAAGATPEEDFASLTNKETGIPELGKKGEDLLESSVEVADKAGVVTGASAAGAGMVWVVKEGVAKLVERRMAKKLMKHGWDELPGLEKATRLSPAERATGERLQNQLGMTLRESPHVGAEYVDDLGRSYDAVGTPRSSGFLNQKEFTESIREHLDKDNDFTVVDVTGFTEGQIRAVGEYIDSLTVEERAKIRKIGFE
ncbi:MAG: hypothetical protein MPN21_28025 [Thermoanaerobaculia bacterium]|nr:hypothetical protein [Thermoanaerobaculia bacterium]